MSTQPFLKISGLSKSYRDKHGSERLRVIDNISFDLLHGECLAVVGESGSGKTTLGRTILRLIESDAGSVLTADGDLLALPQRDFQRLRPKFQMIFQNHSQVFDPRQKIGSALAEPFRVHTRMSPEEIKVAVTRLLRQVGLSPSLLERLPHQLSGGQRQRVAIARALATSPDFLVADEPTSNLDAAFKREIIELLRSVQRELSLTMLLISHDLGMVAEYADRIAVIYEGAIVEIAPADVIVSAPGHPYTKELLAAANLTMEMPESIGACLCRPENTGCPFATRCAWQDVPCWEERPALISKAPRHEVACHRFDEIAGSSHRVSRVDS